MRIVYPEQEAKDYEFAKRAILYFSQNNKAFTYADSDPTAGELLAIRWNPYTVLVVRLCEDFDPACYSVHPTLSHDLPKLEGEV